MNRPQILIAEMDFPTRKQMARTAEGFGCQVKTTISVARLLYQLLHKRFPIVLLGGSIAGDVPIPNLVQLMKTSDPQVVIILIADDISLQQVRRVRELGIFYHALRPVTPDDWQELTLALACALKKTTRLAHASRCSATTHAPRIH